MWKGVHVKSSILYHIIWTAVSVQREKTSRQVGGVTGELLWNFIKDIPKSWILQTAKDQCLGQKTSKFYDIYLLNYSALCQRAHNLFIKIYVTLCTVLQYYKTMICELQLQKMIIYLYNIFCGDGICTSKLMFVFKYYILFQFYFRRMQRTVSQQEMITYLQDVPMGQYECLVPRIFTLSPLCLTLITQVWMQHWRMKLGQYLYAGCVCGIKIVYRQTNQSFSS